jgi:hypothetical protein
MAASNSVNIARAPPAARRVGASSALVHRGVVCVRNFTCIATGDIGTRAKAAIRAAGGIGLLETCSENINPPCRTNSSFGAGSDVTCRDASEVC